MFRQAIQNMWLVILEQFQWRIASNTLQAYLFTSSDDNEPLWNAVLPNKREKNLSNDGIVLRLLFLFFSHKFIDRTYRNLL